MKETIAEYGFLTIAIIVTLSLFLGVIPFFEDGGTIKDYLLDYISNLC